MSFSKNHWLILFSLSLLLVGCDQKARLRDGDLYGVWAQDASGNGKACLILETNNVVVFESVRAKDIALSTENLSAELPHNGYWSLNNKSGVVTLRFIFQGVTYDHSGMLVLTKGEPVLSFVIGDPDMHEMVNFKKR